MPIESKRLSHAECVAMQDAQLWSAIAEGHTAALGVLYDRHAGLVHGIALKVLGNAQEAEDLTQDIFLKLTSSSSYNPKRGSLRTYIAILTRSRAIDRVRSRKTAKKSMQRLQRSSPTSDSSVPMDEMFQQEQSQKVRAALAQLADNQQQILKMAYYDGLTQAKIAEKLNTPLGTVKARARRGLTQLRQVLQNQSNESDI
ncbi:MAG: sigma-70 family RNA polymerase sigma factor [Elainellaceae cyanobacterium]